MQSEYQKKTEWSSSQLSQLDSFKLEMTKSYQRKLQKKRKKEMDGQQARERNPG